MALIETTIIRIEDFFYYMSPTERWLLVAIPVIIIVWAISRSLSR